ncbi:MAG: hypothetical protein JOY96_05070 [Verrucomicrobia bacterium]|nr:hypothetical protein [Verrucomicrobiota bacterium]MBV9671871.1 hypothetical protein [Verrucomicrobiota bacterium]
MKTILGVLIIYALSACQSKPTVFFKPNIAPLTADRTDSPGRELVAINAPRSLRTSATVKVYGMNRYVDSADPNIVHERHAVYRLEQQASWVTRSPQTENEVILGPVVGLRKLEYAPEPQQGEVDRELLQARRGLTKAEEETKLMRANQEKLASSVESLAGQTAEAQRKLTAIVSVLTDRVRRLEGDNGSAPGDASEMDPHGSKTAPDHPSAP